MTLCQAFWKPATGATMVAAAVVNRVVAPASSAAPLDSAPPPAAGPAAPVAPSVSMFPPGAPMPYGPPMSYGPPMPFGQQRFMPPFMPQQMMYPPYGTGMGMMSAGFDAREQDKSLKAQRARERNEGPSALPPVSGFPGYYMPGFQGMAPPGRS